MSILIKNADYVVTMDKERRVLRNASLYIEGPEIKEVNSRRKKADKIINARGMIVLPGFINCHHHMFQCGLRGMPNLQNQKIEKWINIICNMVKQMDEEMIYLSSLANMAELLLYGCTTTADMLYIFPKGRKSFIEMTIKAAMNIGMRFHPYRGSMSLSQKDKSLFPNDVVEDSDTIVTESENLIKKFHDDSPFSMVRVGMAPCTIFTSSKEDYLNAYKLADKYKVNLQTHIGESGYENRYCIQKYKKRPLDYLHDLGWSGRRVSLTHCINITSQEIKRIAQTNTNVVHCPVSNARQPIGEIGVAPVWEMTEQGVNVTIGTDGSAGNDSSNVLEELRWARILQGVPEQSTYLRPMQVLEMATICGAKALNRDDIGSIDKGSAADIAIFDVHNKIESAGAVHSPIGSLTANQAIRAAIVLVNGRIIVEESKLTSIVEETVVQQFNKKIKNKLEINERR